VTGAGLKYLQGMKQLEEIILNGTNTTIPGIRNLEKNLPNLRVSY
jgi:hypothetical protein